MNHQGYLHIVFIDSNIVLEGKPLPQLPWGEIDSEGPILVLIAPTVLREVDSKKRDGRLAVRARDFNRLMGEVIDTKEPLCLRKDNPRVEIYFSSCEKIDWNRYDDLDPSEGDCKVIAEILNSKDVDLTRISVISQDIAPLLYASRHGLSTIRAAETWLLAPEQSPLEKENTKLKRQIAEFSKTEPEVTVLVKFPEPSKIYRVAALDWDQQTNLIMKIQELCPKKHQSRDTWGIGSELGYDSSYDSKYEKFISSRPDFVAGISRRLELNFGQVPIKIEISNLGKIRAENLHVEIKVIGGWINEKPILSTIFPSVPAPEPYNPLIGHSFNRHIDVWPEVGRHDVEVGDMKRSIKVSLQCADFRQGQKWSRSAILWLDPNFDGDVKIITTTTAANMHGTSSQAIVVNREVIFVSPFDLIDPKKCRIVADYNVKALVEESIKNKNFEDFEFEK